jgi:gamma-aminobutyric acid type B receptor
MTFTIILTMVALCANQATGIRQLRRVQETDSPNKLRFVLIPKAHDSAYFEQSRKGCEDGATVNNAICVYEGPMRSSQGPEAALEQVEIFNRYATSEDVDGIAISVLDPDLLRDSINAAIKAGTPVVTFDSDDPDSARLAYVGTDNSQFGYELGKTLIQLNPVPGSGEAPLGKVAYIDSYPAPNLIERHQGFLNRINRLSSNWEEAAGSPFGSQGSSTKAMEHLWNLSKDPSIKAIVGCCGFVMANITEWKRFVKANPNITLVNADANDSQIGLARQGYTNGLVAQSPYEMGVMSINTLSDLIAGTAPKERIIGTSALSMVRIPLTLRAGYVDPNYIGNLKILAYIFFTVICLLCISFTAWTVRNRKTRVVRSSQPEFLVLICLGCLVFGSVLIPLTIDTESHSQRACDIACQSTPWLASIGFTLIFSALFSKTWRINQVFSNARKFRRVTVTVKDVMLPLVLLLSSNVVVLSVWTVLSPMQYSRIAHEGTDAWNRIISSYAICQSNSGRKGEALPYIVILVCINASVVVIANIQAYQARSIKTEFSESRYIAIAVAFIAQALIIGVPVIVLVRQQPQVRFAVLSMTVFAVCFATLILMFMPKIAGMRKAGDEGGSPG